MLLLMFNMTSSEILQRRRRPLSCKHPYINLSFFFLSIKPGHLYSTASFRPPRRLIEETKGKSGFEEIGNELSRRIQRRCPVDSPQSESNIQSVTFPRRTRAQKTSGRQVLIELQARLVTLRSRVCGGERRYSKGSARFF